MTNPQGRNGRRLIRPWGFRHAPFSPRLPLDRLRPQSYRPPPLGKRSADSGVAPMPRACAGLALLLSAGCFWAPPGRPAGLVESLKPFAGLRGADVVVLDVALLEQPVGDRFLNEGLWAAADEQVFDLDRKAVLEDNGFRVGLVGGIPPAEFLALLTVERSCPDPHRVRMPAGNTKPVPLGGSRPLLRFQLHADGQVTPVEFPQAQCVLQITPTL